ncbi:hypothetical protein JOD02_001561 [Caldicoprobacter guelmensis]|uniref:hypothetical protein n=1 Tax=Caldicoprobacter guelmensis TaxID=1170224 RepID=UPI001957CC23|nr:hypothetical protein [Caldicoprobacter guelmensis]MBM7582704.1 hypothetical protein [Caldicoprobacter guelmensis]
MLIKAYNIEEALFRAEKYYNCPRDCLKVYTIRPPGVILWGIIKWRGIYRVEVAKKREEMVKKDKAIDGTGDTCYTRCGWDDGYRRGY